MNVADTTHIAREMTPEARSLVGRCYVLLPPWLWREAGARWLEEERGRARPHGLREALCPTVATLEPTLCVGATARMMGERGLRIWLLDHNEMLAAFAMLASAPPRETASRGEAPAHPPVAMGKWGAFIRNGRTPVTEPILSFLANLPPDVRKLSVAKAITSLRSWGPMIQAEVGIADVLAVLEESGFGEPSLGAVVEFLTAEFRAGDPLPALRAELTERRRS